MSGYRRAIDSTLVVASTAAQHVEQLETLQRVVFPTLAPSELFRAEHYLRHIELFPEGQFVVVAGERVVAMTSTLRLDSSCHRPHTFADVIAGGYLTSHNPRGEWLYGVDLGVHPGFRRRGLARALYAARHDAARRIGLSGQVTVGMLSGYGEVRNEIGVEDYYDAVISGKRSDPTVTAQTRIGFEPRGVIKGYVDDPVCDGCGALLVLPTTTDLAWPTESTEPKEP